MTTDQRNTELPPTATHIGILKKFAPYIGVLLIALGAFIGGLYVGTDFTITLSASLHNPNSVQDATIKAMEDHALLSYLDAGDVKKAVAYLRVKEESSILSIDLLAHYADPRTRLMACRVMKDIAQRRAKYPEKTDGSVAELQPMVDSILKAPKICNDLPSTK